MLLREAFREVLREGDPLRLAAELAAELAADPAADPRRSALSAARGSPPPRPDPEDTCACADCRLASPRRRLQTAGTVPERVRRCRYSAHEVASAVVAWSVEY